METGKIQLHIEFRLIMLHPVEVMLVNGMLFEET